MSSRAERILGQGSKTATVLTNRSNFITIVTDEPRQHPVDHGTFLPAIRKGVRPMPANNTSTLSLEVDPVKTSYVSCMKSSFSGSKSLQPSRRPRIYPSQHTSQFDIGVTCSDQPLNTHSKMTYVNHSTTPTRQIHEHNQRWNEHMSGNDMIESTRQNGNSEMNFDTTYMAVHNKLGKERGPGIKYCPPITTHYNILSGKSFEAYQG
ncbi:hypothetical protein QZH41_017506 [Actinostola sp. cb2023]|nr:hypothetical protein QZH41_017506 [Actinostola sp. cb2023]